MYAKMGRYIRKYNTHRKDKIGDEKHFLLIISGFRNWEAKIYCGFLPRFCISFQLISKASGDVCNSIFITAHKKNSTSPL